MKAKAQMSLKSTCRVKEPEQKRPRNIRLCSAPVPELERELSVRTENGGHLQTDMRKLSGDNFHQLDSGNCSTSPLKTAEFQSAKLLTVELKKKKNYSPPKHGDLKQMATLKGNMKECSWETLDKLACLWSFCRERKKKEERKKSSL